MTASARHATPITFQHVPNPRARTPEERAALMADPVFGTVFTDHMATLRWTPEQGWHDAQIRAREPFQLDPACAVLHYAQEIFEGLKAYRAPDGGITLFDPNRMHTASRCRPNGWPCRWCQPICSWPPSKR